MFRTGTASFLVHTKRKEPGCPQCKTRRRQRQRRVADFRKGTSGSLTYASRVRSPLPIGPMNPSLSSLSRLLRDAINGANISSYVLLACTEGVSERQQQLRRDARNDVRAGAKRSIRIRLAGGPDLPSSPRNLNIVPLPCTTFSNSDAASFRFLLTPPRNITPPQLPLDNGWLAKRPEQNPQNLGFRGCGSRMNGKIAACHFYPTERHRKRHSPFPIKGLFWCQKWPSPFSKPRKDSTSFLAHELGYLFPSTR